MVPPQPLFTRCIVLLMSVIVGYAAVGVHFAWPCAHFNRFRRSREAGEVRKCLLDPAVLETMLFPEAHLSFRCFAENSGAQSKLLPSGGEAACQAPDLLGRRVVFVDERVYGFPFLRVYGMQRFNCELLCSGTGYDAYVQPVNVFRRLALSAERAFTIDRVNGGF